MSDTPTRWTIKRNCSASPRQLALVFASILLVSLIFGFAFASHGLWMVLPFVGIEMLAVAAAFICYGRHATDSERIELSDGEVRLLQVDGSRRVERRWPAPWTRVEVSAPRGVLAHPHVYVGARGERLEVGRLLTDERRLQLARELRTALRGAAA